MDANEDKLKNIAQQLSCPSGEAGVEMGIMMNDINIGMTLESIKALQLDAGQKVLELGHGNAGHLVSLLVQAEGLKYYGLEISTTMHDEAAHINQAFVQNNQAAFSLYEGEKIPFGDEYFDRIFTVNTLYFWQNPVDFLNEIYRVLKKNGCAIVTFAHKEFMQTLPFTQYIFELYSNADFEKLVKQTAFAQSEILERSENIKTKMGEDATRTYSVARLQK